MFKFVVLCVFAVAVAEPDPALLYGTPWISASYPSVIPTINQAGLIAQPSLVYSSPYSHFIKKRSADPEPEANPEPEAKPDPQLLTYSSSNIFYPGGLTTPVINPLINSGYPWQTQIPLATHLIKKRSAQFIAPSTYVPSTYALPSLNPYLPTTYLGNNVYSGVDTVLHLIKKRSAVLPYATSYSLPTAYYGNGYIPALSSSWNLGSNLYGSPVLGLHAIKKRSAQLTSPAFYTPTTYAGSPWVTSTYTAGSPLISSLPYVASPYSTYIKK